MERKQRERQHPGEARCDSYRSYQLRDLAGLEKHQPPLEHSTPAAKAYFAECILKAAAQGKTSYDALIVAAADQIEVFVALFS
jgi:hypothetical protein